MIRTFLSLFILILLMGCVQKKKEELIAHPLEINLVPNVQVANELKYYGIDERLAYHNISGINLGIIEDYQLSHNRGYGFARVAEGTETDSSTIYSVGSISKSVVGLMALILEEQGVLSLDSSIDTYLKDWQLPQSKFTDGEEITLRHLLNHSAGINPFNSKGVLQSEPLPTLIQVLEGGKYSPGVSIDTIPGALHKYSNLGYGIVQLALENHMGKSLETLAKSLVFEPLGMKSSSFQAVKPTKENTRYAYGHNYDNIPMEGKWRKSLIPASGGLKSTVKDLSIFLLAINDALKGNPRGNITPDIAKQIVTEKGYNLGFEIDGEEKDLSITHTGRVPGFFAYMRMYPNTGKGLIMLCNSDNGGEIFKDILRGASEVYGWDIIKPKVIKPIATSLSELRNYVGEYSLTIDSTTYMAEVFADNDQLQFKMKDEDEIYPLRMVEKDRFIDMIDGSSLDFIVADSIVKALVLDNDLTFEKE